MSGLNGSGTVEQDETVLPLLTLLRKHKARIAEYEQIVSEGQAALTEARRSFALAQKRIAGELGLDIAVETAKPAAVMPGPAQPRWHRRSYKAVLESLETNGAEKSKALAARLNITEGAASGACHRLVRDGKAIRIGAVYQAVKP